MSDKLIDECQKVIGYKFKDVNLLELSLTHSSCLLYTSPSPRD